MHSDTLDTMLTIILDANAPRARSFDCQKCIGTDNLAAYNRTNIPGSRSILDGVCERFFRWSIRIRQNERSLTTPDVRPIVEVIQYIDVGENSKKDCYLEYEQQGTFEKMPEKVAAQMVRGLKNKTKVLVRCRVHEWWCEVNFLG